MVEILQQKELGEQYVVFFNLSKAKSVIGFGNCILFKFKCTRVSL